MAKSRRSNSNVQPNPIPGEPAPQSALAALRSTSDKLRAQKEEKRRREEITVEDVKKYKTALNAVIASPNGKYVFRALLRYMQFFEVPSENQLKMIEENGMKRLYLKMIRQFLEPTIKAELENI